jgi:hypothetical protein
LAGSSSTSAASNMSMSRSHSAIVVGDSVAGTDRSCSSVVSLPSVSLLAPRSVRLTSMPSRSPPTRSSMRMSGSSDPASGGGLFFRGRLLGLQVDEDARQAIDDVRLLGDSAPASSSQRTSSTSVRGDVDRRDDIACSSLAFEGEHVPILPAAANEPQPVAGRPVKSCDDLVRPGERDLRGRARRGRLGQEGLWVRRAGASSTSFSPAAFTVPRGTRRSQ